MGTRKAAFPSCTSDHKRKYNSLVKGGRHGKRSQTKKMIEVWLISHKRIDIQE